MKLPNFENWSNEELYQNLTFKVKFWHFLTARHYSDSPNLVISFDYSWFLAKNLSNLVSFPWKLYNRHCHSLHVPFQILHLGFETFGCNLGSTHHAIIKWNFANLTTFSSLNQIHNYVTKTGKIITPWQYMMIYEKLWKV